MQLVQFFAPSAGRRLGLVRGESIVDLTGQSGPSSVIEATLTAFRRGIRLAAFVDELAAAAATESLAYESLLAAEPGGRSPWLLPPVDHADLSRVLVSGTGLTHLGSVQSRDEMHGGQGAAKPVEAVPQTDSAKMFAMGLAGGKPAVGARGAAPEWFYKGNGHILRGPRSPLTLPAHALDGGEEPEIVGCYVIDDAGRPRQLGFTLGNEWSDHATEKINYLYLAPSKLRECAIGPSLNVGDPFQDVRLRCTVMRGGESLYDSGPLRSGESAMCHSLANIEDHHFKFAQHRRPGDVHIHYFGTSKLSYSTRNWKYQPGDEIRIEAPGFSAPLVNRVDAGPSEEGAPVRVEPA